MKRTSNSKRIYLIGFYFYLSYCIIDFISNMMFNITYYFVKPEANLVTEVNSRVIDWLAREDIWAGLLWTFGLCAMLFNLSSKHIKVVPVGTQVRFSPTYAAFTWFIPIGNIWLPYQAVKEIQNRIRALWHTSLRPAASIHIEFKTIWALWISMKIAFLLYRGFTKKEMTDEEWFFNNNIYIALSFTYLIIMTLMHRAMIAIDRDLEELQKDHIQISS